MRINILASITFTIGMLPWAAAGQEARQIDHTLPSVYPAQDRTFSVHLPDSYASQSDVAYPVLYVLDGETNFEFSVAVAGYLAQNALAPEVIVVGVHANATRERDYLPLNPTGGQPSGQALQFLNYLEEELIPFVGEHYRAAPLRLISGHSYGGALVIYAMAERPELFRAYLAQSPFLDPTVGGPLVDKVSGSLSSSALDDAFFFMNLGAEPALEPTFARMEELLQGRTSGSFAWFARRLPEQTHMTTRMLGLYEGLERFFAEEWTLPNAVQALIDGGSEGLNGHLERLSFDYGQPVTYTEEAFQQITQAFAAGQALPSAVTSAQLYVRQHPESPVAYFMLAVMRAQSGDREGGLEAIGTAIRLYESEPDPELRPLYEQMKQIKLQLGGG